ncbi:MULTISPECIES: tryptophan 2,3-dioxygenase [Thermoactinomyces]|jgi:tryptophan 2,3-dioxygenase|uniref:Tryptophan 2,3-dioxygenase n=1 Tax=Thermoactinomyces vulgaris TaxID=2026 RepID=A0ABS0QF53_THEVU|nr:MULTISPECIES: tryptophan 2,3-dioxygenase [Thermoactinomyces]KFZ40924.1 tryptophan 2,3-dioxygenase [Thermoactinomyces sp. Gus2-1]KYQ87381.1 tryptophan 2,3-dioxygenase [Thermoactinomyces sp. AS95]MBA4551470.1 tryptophan 2,3-dioxygenase [Thermoactinomyces vulgaris]MBA4595320.1 tryptophan 2,3-dioxygenase [Thermoactinomyces vulgaris]MBH8587895.1 tryptophan 2,3-dioxygenase [Thermoactinomyces vulgaris]
MNPEEGIHTDFREQMTYGDYLRLHLLLDCQKLLSGHHDEMLFVIIHQTSELWMKLMIHELEAAMESIRTGDLPAAFKMLSRFSKIQSQIIQSWDVLSTLTPSEYMKFRGYLGHASGFQSYQYRMIEFYLGKKSTHILKIYENDPVLLEKLKQAYEARSIYDVSIEALHKAGFSIDEKVLNRDVRKPYQYEESVEQAWLQVYQNVEKYWDLYELAEKLVDLEDWFQQWRFRHMKTVERIIGYKKGTGGSSGVSYLKKGLDQSFFPELWHVRTKLQAR